MARKTLWEQDAVQFPRLLAEIMATVEINDSAWRELCESMDLSGDEILQIFDRAQREWERLLGNSR